MITDFADVFHVPQNVAVIEYKDSARVYAQILNQSPVGGSERTGSMIGQHHDIVHAHRSAPALHGKGQVHAEGVDFDSIELLGGFIKALGLHVANRRIERGDDAKNLHAAAHVSQRD